MIGGRQLLSHTFSRMLRCHCTAKEDCYPKSQARFSQSVAKHVERLPIRSDLRAARSHIDCSPGTLAVHIYPIQVKKKISAWIGKELAPSK